MGYRIFAAGAALGLATVAAAQVPVGAPPEPGVRDLRVANMPLIAGPLDLAQPSDPIWIKGPQPTANTIARLTLRPLEAVVVDADMGQGLGKPLILSLTLVGEAGRDATAAAPTGDKVYCAAGVGAKDAGRILCLADRDGDRRFDARMSGLGEVGGAPEQVAVVGPYEALPAPVAYRVARTGEAPTFPVIYRNCAKDHDRPRYSFAAEAKAPPVDLAEMLRANDPRNAQMMSEIMNRTMVGRGAPCQAADGMPATDPAYPRDVPKGSVVAQLGELVIAVAPKERGAGVRLVGLADPQLLYRLNGIAVVPLSSGATAKQNALGISQKFDRPVIMTAGSADVRTGLRRVGDVVLTTSFAHGYTGVLTQDTTIRTLLSKRSLPKGTLLYGVPMSSRTVMTINGVPRGPTNSGPTTADDVRLVWCVPVQEADAKTGVPQGKWTATCLPTQGGTRHTILKGQLPAFEVASLRYDAGTSTNDGPAPVEERAGSVGASAFGGPLTYRFTMTALSADAITITQDTMVGDTAVFSRVHRVPRAAGNDSGLSFADGMVAFSGSGADGVTVTQQKPFAAGKDLDVRFGVLRKDAAAAAAASGT